MAEPRIIFLVYDRIKCKVDTELIYNRKLHAANAFNVSHMSSDKCVLSASCWGSIKVSSVNLVFVINDSLWGQNPNLAASEFQPR